MKTLFMAVLMSVVAGCTLAHPTDSIEQIAARSKSALPPAAGDVHFIHTGAWAPNTTTMSSIVALSDSPNLRRGTFVVTASGVHFLAWSASSATYTPLLFVRASDVRSIDTSEFWRVKGRLIVIEHEGGPARAIGTSQRQPAFDGFLITSPRGATHEARTDEALTALRRLVNRAPAPK